MTCLFTGNTLPRVFDSRHSEDEFDEAYNGKNEPVAPRGLKANLSGLIYNK